LKTKDRILASIYNISQLLTGSASLDRILNKIVRETQSIFGLQRVALFLINRSANTLDCIYLVGFNPEETQRAKSYPLDLDRHRCRETLAVKTGKTILIKDAGSDSRVTETDIKMDRFWKRVSTITAPLKVKKDIIGVLEGDRTNETLELSRQEINLFSLFANQASIIIENARLQEQNRKKINQLLYLQETTKKTSSVLDFRKLLGIIVASAMNVTCAEAAFIFLKNRDSFRVAAYKGYPKFDRKEFHLGHGQGITGCVAEAGLPVMSNDVRTDPRYIELLEGVRSQISVPLFSGDRTSGVLTVVSDSAGAFTADDMNLLMLLSSHISVVIKNVSLYEQIISERNIAENILESSPNGIITVDSKWRINSMNKRAEEILKLNRPLLLGKSMVAALPEEIVDALVRPGAAEVRLRDGGRDMVLGVSQCALRTKEKGASGILISIQDLTDLKKTEEIIGRMDRLSSLGQLSAGIAHEIRNPLASISFNVQMLAKKNSDRKEREILKDTMAGVERINNLVKGILDFAKPRIPDLNHGQINKAIRDSVALMDLHFRKKGIKVVQSLEKGLPEIVFDSQQVRQVFINILLNAVEAMPSGGELFIASRLEGPAEGDGRRIAVQIRDNGCGIPEKNRARIFDPFFTTKPEGTGLGLSIVHQILNQHNASIDILSEENVGTVFIIRFEVDGERIDVPIQNTDSR
jgi:two-component system NtrC family sensor kinase